MPVDLHIHTNASDGVYTPEEVVIQASKASLEAIAITDHDTINGIVRAQEAAKNLNIEIIPGIELSAKYKDDDLHILGYYVDITKQEFLAKLTELCCGRKERTVKIIYKLHKLGIKIDLEDIVKIANNAPITRSHIAKTMVNVGIVKIKEEAFSKYMGFGKPAYVAPMTLDPLDAIKLILLADGVPVLAHPGIRNEKSMDLFNELIVSGLRGIEIYHPEHTKKQIKQYTKIAKKNNLIITGGTDFHGDNKHLHKIGSFSVSYKVVEELKYASKKHR